jgi:hypothetical protein
VDSPSPPYELVLVDGDSKLELQLSQRLSRLMDMGPDDSEIGLTVAGLLDASGNLIEGSVIEGEQLERWQAVWKEQLGRLCP